MGLTAPSLPAGFRTTACLLFLLSGASGLIFEALWTYQATLALGSSTGAMTAVLAAFMAGLALGNLLSLRKSVWSLSTYAALEVLILVSGLAALALLPSVGGLLAPLLGALAPWPALLNLLRFSLAFAMLAVPSTAMGMTLPALVQALGHEHGSFRSVLGGLYGFNTAGAIAGVLVAELFLLPKIGVFGAGFCAALLNGAAAVGAWRLRRSSQGPAASQAPPPWDGRVTPDLRLPLLAVFLAGLSLLALEVVWSRFLAVFVPNSSLAFALMLATVLAGIALGGIAGGSSRIPRTLAGLLPLGAGVALLVSYAVFPLVHRSTGALVSNPMDILGLGFVLQFPVSVLSGAFFTLAGVEFRDRIASSQASAGLLVLANTLGAATGAIAGGYLLVPGLGVEKSFVGISIVYVVTAALWVRAFGIHRRWLFGAGAAWIFALAVFPFGVFQKVHLPDLVRRWTPQPDSRLLAVREGLTETLVYVQVREFGQPLFTRMIANSFSMSSNAVASDRYMKQFVYWPVAVHPSPKRALLICFGVGGTARALTRTRELEHIDVVDLSRDILELSDLFFPDPATHPLRDPRVRVHVEDGRFFLRTRSETWDIITGEPPPPELPGVAGLYSREYFQLLKDRLSEGGIATYWLPIHSLSVPAARSILRAWSDVFEHCFLWRGSQKDLMLTGFKGRPSPCTESRFAVQWEDRERSADLADVGLEVPETLGTGFIGDAAYIRSITAESAPTEDAFPKRIIAPGDPDKAFFNEWYNIPACAARFRDSAAIAELWPPELRQRTQAYFPWEGILTTLGTAPVDPQFPDFAKLHRLCTTTTLKAPVHYLLVSNRDDQRALDRADAEQRGLPVAQFHLGVRALADREYGKAADHLLRTLGVEGMRRIHLGACLFALCMAGRKEEAERSLSALWDEDKMRAIPAEYWATMKSAFDLKIPAGKARSR